MAFSEDSSAASSEKRTALLEQEGEGYTLVLWEDKTAKLGVAIDSKDDIVGKRDAEKGLKWRNSRGVAIEGAAYKLVTKGSSFVFEGERYPVEEDTPFEPANGKKSFRLFVRLLLIYSNHPCLTINYC